MYKTKKLRERNAKITSYLKGNWNLRRSQCKWAGGNHHVTVNLVRSPNKVAADGSSRYVWSRNGKWSGTDSWVSITATYRTLKIFPMLTTPDGMHLVDARLLAPRIYQIKWLQNARGFDLKIIDGWLIKGYHIEAMTLDDALKKIGKIRAAAARILIKQRAENRGNLTLYRRIWVSFEDSIAGGNCRPGTEQFLKNKLLPYLKSKWGKVGEIGAVRGDLLFNFAGDNPLVRRALMAAVQRCKEIGAVACGNNSR